MQTMVPAWKRRLLAGEKISVHAQVVAEHRDYTIQDVVWSIPGTDPFVAK